MSRFILRAAATSIVLAGASSLFSPSAAAAISTAPAPVSTAQAPATAAICANRVANDYNGDGHADIAVGEPGKTIDGTEAAGQVHIIYGSSSGLSTQGSQLIDETTLGAPVQRNAEFGQVVASGFINDDCYADIVVFAGDNVDDNEADGFGALWVLFGSADGIHESQHIGRAQYCANCPGGGARAFAMTVGDFNGDDRSDVAVGFDNSADVGLVAVLYGGSDGLTTTGQYFDQDSPGVPGTNENDDFFGQAVAAGDFTGDGYADLAIAAPDERVGTVAGAGDVIILRGSASGLTATGSQVWQQGSPGVPGANELGDGFGSALAAGDITGDGKADLVVATPGEGITHVANAGVVTIFHGSSLGLTTSGIKTYDQNTAGVPGTAEVGDFFGSALTMGDFNGDGHADVAIGDDWEDVGSVVDAGSVTILYGRSGGLTTTGAQAFSQDSSGVPGTAEIQDFFGSTLFAAPIATPARDYLMVGVIGEDSDGLTDNGAIEVFPSTSHGVTGSGSALLTASTLQSAAGVSFAEFGMSIG